jgi:hypothetical protein
MHLPGNLLLFPKHVPRVAHVVTSIDRPGDLEVRWRDSESIFAEVKGPGWDGELTQEEIKTGRQHAPKYSNAEARFVNPVTGCYTPSTNPSHG